ncbi:MAG: 5-methyltetrahydropteroyltriglutamate--homocysteine S-methyltransferase [Candidatus Marinimicrobia bacterium]|nr:5-methyltetrahydropteroyltriglutamate--homocysteine S-methyltransferase [Candidatus Neomarinimicrobiota bacterium]
MKTYAYGFPRIGKNREYKKITEKFWAGKITKEDLGKGLHEIEKSMKNTYAENVDGYPTNEMTMYDKMLDTAIMVGLYNPNTDDDYFKLCRGENALEMTKWFNTNYHYLVPDFSKFNGDFKYNINYLPTTENPHFIGPFTFLKLSKGIDNFEDYALSLVKVYRDMLSGYDTVHIDEPAFVMDLKPVEVFLIKKIYDIVCDNNTTINLFTYYEDVDWLRNLVYDLPVNGVGLDFVNGKNNFRNVISVGFSKDKTLFAGLVDGRNVWRTNTRDAVNKLNKLSKFTDKIVVTNAGPLYHLPITLKGETHLSHFLYQHLSFATEKLEELNDIKNKDHSKFSVYVGDWNNKVKDRVGNLKDDDFVKSLDVTERRKLQDKILNLPELPTTTIGSFPQTKDVRLNRLDYKKGRIDTLEYNENIRKFIREALYIQEKIGMDVLVHGESERSDMVEYFCQRLDGISSLDNGWIISYGTRVYRPSIIHGDVSRSKPMTINEIAYAQSLTDKPVKGMLTGAVTIMAWDYVRKDIPIDQVAYQIALSLQDEIREYGKVGIKMVQVDEPAFREMMPIKKRYHNEYFDWAIKSFNLTTNTNPRTQIHSHMCYSEFNEIVEQINKLDFDVISIECSRSGGEIIEAFEKIDFKRQIGLGVWDIHSPAIPSKDDMVKILKRALKVIPRSQFWINPDCGLKTRGWKETKESMKNMVEARLEVLNN